MSFKSITRRAVKLAQPSRLFRGRMRIGVLSRLDGFCIGRGTSIANGCEFVDGAKQQIVDLGERVDIRQNCVFYIGEIHIGDDTFIGRDCFFHSGIFHADADPGSVTIGSRCDIAPKVTFLCGTHKMGGAARRAGAALSKDIVVGDGVWIGSNATILPGVHIGSGSVVGAGAVVAKDVPDNSVVVGSPARVIKNLD